MSAALADQDIGVLPASDFWSIATQTGDARDVLVRHDDDNAYLCQLADETVAWAKDQALHRSVTLNLYYRAWRMMAKARHHAAAVHAQRVHPAQPTSVSVALAREGDHLVACFTINAEQA